jgi:hypothetical protein
MRVHASPFPGVGTVHSISGPLSDCSAGPPICSKQTPPSEHAQAALAEPDPELDPEPSIDPHVPGEHTQDGSFGGHAQPVPNHMHASSLWHVVAVVNATHGSPLSAGSFDVAECAAQPASATTTAANRVMQSSRARSRPRATRGFVRRDTQNSVVPTRARRARRRSDRASRVARQPSCASVRTRGACPL